MTIPAVLAFEESANATFDLRAALLAAAEKHRKGQLQEAEDAYRRILDKHGRQPEALFMLAMAMSQSGQIDHAIELLRGATAVRRSQPNYWAELGRLYHETGQLAEAEAALQTAIDLDPWNVVAHIRLGQVQIGLGRREEGSGALKRGIRLALIDRIGAVFAALQNTLIGAVARILHLGDGAARARALAQCRIGSRLERRGRHDEAMGRYRLALEADPDCTEAPMLLGDALYVAEAYIEALVHYEDVLAIDPDHARALAKLAIVLIELGRFDEAVAHVERAAALRPDDREVQLARGFVHYHQGRPETSRAQFAQILERSPNDAQARFGLGVSLLGLGQPGEACAELERAIVVQPDHVGAIHWLSTVRDGKPEVAEFERVDRLLDRRTLSPKSRRRLHFAAGRMLDAVGDYDAAFRHYRIGNDLKDVTFDPDAHDRRIDGLIAAFGTALFERKRGIGDASELPLLIVGMPRSGTSLVEQIVSSHPMAAGAGELEDLSLAAADLQQTLRTRTSYPDCVEALDEATAATLARAYLQRLRSISGEASRITDKMPNNMFHLGLAALLFPQARIIHCRRDPMDICTSIYRLDFGGYHPYAYDLTNLGHYYRGYERLMEHWSGALPLPILDVQYEELVENQEEVTRRIVEFSGLAWDDACLTFHKAERSVGTWSAHQVRKPLYKGASGRWRRYEAHLGPLQLALGL